jgi:hypothetical protein
MKQLIKLFSVIIVLSYSGITFGQDSLITSMAKENLTMFIKEGSSFSGPGWNIIIEQTIDENSSMLKWLRPFFKAVTGEQWHCFNLIPLREAQEDEKLIVKDITLSRIINGYDLLIIVPVVTAAKLIEII